MENQFSRTEILIGTENLSKLAQARVVVFGVGGVGGYVVEALVRSGIGAIDIIDNAKVDITNLNRQIIALHSTVGKPKIDVIKERIYDINPDCKVTTYPILFTPETKFDFTKYDYIVDAIDTVSAKIEIVLRAKESNIPIISSMGTGNKLHPERFEITDIYKTSYCPLAKVMRTELKKRRVKKLKVLYSKEIPIKHKEKYPASAPFVPPVAGLIIAGEVVRNLCGIKS